MNTPVKPDRAVSLQTPGDVTPTEAPAKPPKTAKSEPAKPSERLRESQDYRQMRAADIDPTTLTAPVLTLDGYLCPPTPEAKK
jgi:hypothetical protein